MKAVEIYAHLEQSHVDDGVVAVAANIGASVKNMRDSCGTVAETASEQPCSISSESPEKLPIPVVGDTGIEPVTPTMSM